MKVVILCGGLGTRLREETEFRPKPMVEVGGRPILWHIMKSYAHYGFREFVLCLGYKGSIIKDYFLNYEAMNNDFSICLGAEGPDPLSRPACRAELRRHPRRHRHRLHDRRAHSQNREVRRRRHLSHDLRRWPDRRRHPRPAGVSQEPRQDSPPSPPCRPSSRFGMIDMDDNDRVGAFDEKPKTDGWIERRLLRLQSRGLRLPRRRRLRPRARTPGAPGRRTAS